MIEKNQFTTLFQNMCLDKAGRYNLQPCPETSVQHLINLNDSLKQKRLKIKIVPVSISYERSVEDTFVTDALNLTSLQQVDGVYSFMD